MKCAFILLFFLPFLSKGQLIEKDKTIAHLGRGQYIIELMQSPSTKAVMIYFQNRKFEQLTDIQHIDLEDKEAFLELIRKMDSVDADHMYDGKEYVISGQKGGLGGLYLSVYNPGMQGYFQINKNKIREFSKAAEKLQ